MSTERQRYSIENQAAVIAAYANAHSLKIVETYADAGESGLRINNRGGLKRLINDVTAGAVDFTHLLVHDVSRWGRFQDTDESAHYEFICKRAGVHVEYCAEQFDNDGSMLSSIMKNLKRVMAAEYSRELSVKVHAGACRMTRLGLKIGSVGYALARELVDENLRSKGLLKKRERKYLTTDHVRVCPGDPEEVDVVQWIFARFLENDSDTAIAPSLNERGLRYNNGRKWCRGHINRILRNEAYVGNLVYNRRSNKLKQKYTYNPPDQWVRGVGCVAPIVDADTFLKVQNIIEERRHGLTDDEALARLRNLYVKEGHLSPSLIANTPGLPCTATYMHRFGSLREAYRLVGYTPKRNYNYLDSRTVRGTQVADLAAHAVERITTTGHRVIRRDPTCFKVTGGPNVSFRCARWQPGLKANHSPYWRVERQAKLPEGWIAAIRLTTNNESVLDYVLLPTPENRLKQVRFSEGVRRRRGFARFKTPESLLRAICRRV